MDPPDAGAGPAPAAETTASRAGGSPLEKPWVAAEGARGEAAPPLVDITQFREEWKRVLSPGSPRVDHLHLLASDGALLHPDPLGSSAMIGDDAEEGLVPLPDLSCDDIFIGTAHQQINFAVEREIAKPDNKELLDKGLTVNAGAAMLMMRANVPNAVHLAAEKQAARSHLISLKEKDEAEKEARGKKRKEVNYLTPNMQTAEGPFEPIDSDEVVIAIAVYHHKKQIKIQEYLVLASQKLSQLRDKITCVSDLLPEPNSKSGYFFFENVFYDDMREPSNIRYSTSVIDWANAKRRAEQEATHQASPELSALQYSARHMEDTTWADLKVRIGVPYLYCHQGDCEHRVIITDIRLVTKDDEKNKNAYPLHTFQSKIRRKKCVICDIYPATRLTYGDELSPQNPCFFCERCYRPFHYSFEGALLRPYEVFDYHHE